MVQCTNRPKVSILIPVYNRENLIIETLDSAINQTYDNTEIIIVDNNSTDKTFDILKEFSNKYPKVKIFKNEKNIGPVKNWQMCNDYANGEYVKILWSDDLIDKKFIEKTLPYLIDNENIGFVFTQTIIFNNGFKEVYYNIGDTGVYDKEVFINGSLFDGPFPVSPGNALFRKKDVKKNLLTTIPNKFDINYESCGTGNDLLIFLLTLNDYSKFAYINESLSFFRLHKDSLTISHNKNKSFNYKVAKYYFIDTLQYSHLKKLQLKLRIILKKHFANIKNLIVISRGYKMLKGEAK